MNNITLLVREYKKTNSQKIMNDIYLKLTPLMQSKAKFIFYKKFYPYSLYHKCKECLNCKEKNKIICESCERCSCIKGTFNLNKSGLCDYLDVENDLWIEVLRIIKNYNPKKDFDTYLYACLWEWIPSFLTKNFVKSLKNKSLIYFNESGEENEIDAIDENFEHQLNIFSMEEILNICDNIEKKIVKLLYKGLKQKEIAQKIKVSEQFISLKIQQLGKKLKNLLDF